MPYTQGTRPHIRSSESVPKFFWTGVLSLLPALCVFLFIYQGSGARLVAVSAASALLGEAAGRNLFGRKPAFSDGSSVLSGLLFALLVSPDLPTVKVTLAIFLALFLGRECFGGLGAQFFSLPLLGAAFLQIFSPEALLAWKPEIVLNGALCFGGLILIWKKLIYWEVPLLYFIFFFLFAFLFEKKLPSNLFVPGFFLTGFYFVTDPVTTPLTRNGARMFALGSALLGAGLRLGPFGDAGAYLGVLVMNALSPWIDAWLQPRTVSRMKAVPL